MLKLYILKFFQPWNIFQKDIKQKGKQNMTSEIFIPNSSGYVWAAVLFSHSVW